MDIGPSHQSLKAADFWCRLLEQHHPEEVLDARLLVFRRWPSSSSAARLYRASGTNWAEHRDEVFGSLRHLPPDAVLFVLTTLKDVPLAWHLAGELRLGDQRTWHELLKAYEKIVPLATLPRHESLVRADLTKADAHQYQLAARRLARMRRLAAGTAEEAGVDALIAELREIHRRRPRLQAEFDRAGLPR